MLSQRRLRVCYYYVSLKDHNKDRYELQCFEIYFFSNRENQTVVTQQVIQRQPVHQSDI